MIEASLRFQAETPRRMNRARCFLKGRLGRD
jgi:hypothetical protein